MEIYDDLGIKMDEVRNSFLEIRRNKIPPDYSDGIDLNWSNYFFITLVVLILPLFSIDKM